MSKVHGYVNVKSMTWWGGVLAISLGVAGVVMPNNYAVTEFGKVVMLMLGGDAHASPGFMIAFGMSVIGIRAKQERDSQKEITHVHLDT